jgi:hypothetical protein
MNAKGGPPQNWDGWQRDEYEINSIPPRLVANRRAYFIEWRWLCVRVSSWKAIIFVALA